MAPAENSFDVIIIGAGITGINTAYRLQKQFPHLSHVILEGRDCMGGTWSFWKYPNVRSDADMNVFGFDWHPWNDDKALGTAPQISAYIEDAAASAGIDSKIRYRHRINEARWSSDEQGWTLTAAVTDPDGTGQRTEVFKSWWTIFGTGVYNYDKPQQVVIPGLENFKGRIMHPQFWDESINYEGQRIALIGSGATAVTLLPALAEKAKTLTMIQRSPSYVVALSRWTPWRRTLYRWLPLRLARPILWWMIAILIDMFVVTIRAFPDRSRRRLMDMVERRLPPHVDVQTHFNPRYKPWDQRVCFCPSGDFFRALHKPNVTIVTDTIDEVTATGIRLRSSDRLVEADMIVTATGLHIDIFAGLAVYVDDECVNTTLSQRFIWNGCMLEGVPNASHLLGYFAGVWTPGVDIRAKTVLKVMRHQQRTGARVAVPLVDEAKRKLLPQAPATGRIQSTYVLAAADRVPLTSGAWPWKIGESFLEDYLHYMLGGVEKGITYIKKTDEAKKAV